MALSDKIRYIGVNDHEIDLFEGMYTVPNGMCYNSYLILDEKTAVLDTSEAKFTEQWLSNIKSVLGDKAPDYLVVHHMEPDHSANILYFKKIYPDTTIVASDKAFVMMKAFFGNDFADNRIVAGEGTELCLGEHTLSFFTAPMVHWPEVIMSYEKAEMILFSADGFGKFGALDVDEPWNDEARRYYFGIVGKYGMQTQAILQKAASLEVKAICPLHGPILTENLEHYIGLYAKWSSYEAEVDGVMIAYTSIYGHTKKAVDILFEKLQSAGVNVIKVDLARTHFSEAVAEAFRYNKIVLASTTYNAGVFPFMREFIEHLTARNYQSRTVAFIENGSWAPFATRAMSDLLKNSKNMTYLESNVTIRSALDDTSMAQLEALAAELIGQNVAAEEKNEKAYAAYTCDVCGYEYNEAAGDPDNGIAPGTKFENLPSDWVCPVCGVGIDEFSKN